jgi:hypothetical protein
MDPQTNVEQESATANREPTTGAGKVAMSQQGTPEGSCPTCGTSSATGGTPSFVYALGRIEARFPSLSVEKEFAQVSGRSDTAGLTDRQVMRSILSKSENRYLARQLCWVLTIEGLDTYVLMPRNPADFHLLTEAVRPTPRPADLDVVIGVRGPIASPAMCNGLLVPIVGVDCVYSFDQEALLAAIPRPEKVDQKKFAASAAELLDRISCK